MSADRSEDRSYLELEAAARRAESPEASTASGGDANGDGVWSPRAGGPPALLQGGESPVTQYVPTADTDDEEAGPPPPVKKGKPKGGLLGCLCCFRGGEDAADSGPAEGPPSPRPLYIPPAPHVGKPFIPPQVEGDRGKKTLVLDLDETLVHSSFKPVPNPDYVIPVEIDGKVTDVYVLKRPFVDRFLEEVGQKYEVVVFTASLSKYADPLLDLLDTSNSVRWRLFRESCYPYEGNYVKDLTCLGREMKNCIIVDNSPHSYIFQPFNAIPIRNFIDDMTEKDLLDLLPRLLAIADVDDVSKVIRAAYLQNVTPVYGPKPGA